MRNLLFLMIFASPAFAQVRCVQLLLNAPLTDTRGFNLDQNEGSDLSQFSSIPVEHLRFRVLTTSDAFFERWTNLQTFDPVYVYQQLLLKWARLIGATHGEEASVLFLTTTANRLGHSYQLSSRLFGTLPSLNDFAITYAIIRPKKGDGYTPETVRAIEWEMAMTLKDGLDEFQKGLSAEISPAAFLERRIAESGISDDEFALATQPDFLVNKPFLRLAFKTTPQLTDALRRQALATLTLTDEQGAGIILGLPEPAAATMRADIKGVGTWIEDFRKESKVRIH